MKIVGFHSSHDSSYSVLEDGVPKVHNEIERFNRIKNCVANSIKFFLDNDEDVNDIDIMATHRTGGPKDHAYMDDFNRCEEIVKKNGGKIVITEEEMSNVSKGDLIGMYYEPKTKNLILKEVDTEDLLQATNMINDKVDETYDN